MAVRIAFTGLAGVGKTTAADYVVEKYGALKLSWANPVKLEVFEFLRNWNINQFYQPPEWAKINQAVKLPNIYSFPLPPQSISDWELQEKLDWVNANKKWLRSILQWWGTDFRRARNENYWVEQGCKFIDVRGSEVNITCDDSRFSNEGDELLKRGFIIAQINRPGTVQLDHSSEQLEIEPDVEIENNKSIEHLYKEIDKVIEHVSPKFSD